ncbi:MAG: sigma-70 family RNA polymerase sigma factor [Bacteroidales bacterium]|nr:sigma-70 family RNA polymerase sigma factor [Bacteroidales bacterium]
MSSGTTESERLLVERLQLGDEEAKQEFYESFYSLLAGTCARYIPKEREIHDVLQNTFLKILSKIDGFEYRGAGSFNAWCHRIAVNESLMFLRSKKRLKLFVPFDVRFMKDISDPETEPEPEGSSINTIPQQELVRMISNLPEKYRLVFNLYIFEEKSHREIASILNIKEDSSASDLHRARKILSKSINDYLKGHNNGSK